MPPSDVQRLALAVERLTDQLKEDLRDVDDRHDKLSDRLRDVLEACERIETRLRRMEGRDNTGPIPVVVRDSTSAPIALQAPDATQPTKNPFDDERSVITADREKLVLRWELIGSIWRWGRWGLLPAIGAAGHHFWYWLTHLR